MHKTLACIDTRGNTDAVVDWAAWAALRLDGALEFLHVLERHPEVAAVTDFSGTIGVDAQESLLKTLSDQDELNANLTIMLESVNKLTDLATLRVNTMSEYLLRSL